MRKKKFEKILERGEMIPDDQLKHDILSTYFTCRHVLDSIVVSIPACHAGDRGSIPRRGANFFPLASGNLEDR